MKNPFPGMNPYLEAHWRDVHTSLVTYATLEVTRGPEPPLAPEDAHWLDQCLRQAGLRK